MVEEPRILVVEDDRPLRESIQKYLAKEHLDVREAENLHSARSQLNQERFDLILLDLTLPDGNGLEILEKLPAESIGRVIVLSGTGTIETAVRAMKSGAFDFLQKPVNPDILLLAIRRALEFRRAQAEAQDLKREIGSGGGFEQFVFTSLQMAEIIETAKRYAATDRTILISGETGTGKELMAQAIQRCSQRRNGPFVIVNCASIPENLAESELFGFKKGAFTGAHHDYPGKFLQADRGTLFLDEIGELPLGVQAKLLRALEKGEVTPLKGSRPQTVDTRVIAASNKDLKKEVEFSRFRQDLFYRIDELKIHIPPLRERPEDILPLARHFLHIANLIHSLRLESIDEEAARLLAAYPWPGNVRELRNAIFKISLNSNDRQIRPEHLPLHIQSRAHRVQSVAANLSLKKAERDHILRALEQVAFNLSQAAERLGISRSSLYRKLDEHQLHKKPKTRK